MLPPAFELYQECRADIRINDADGRTEDAGVAFSAQRCNSYLQGFVDGLRMRPKLVCLGGASFTTLSRVYVSFIERHPTSRDGARWTALLLALEESYPCPK